MNPKQYVIAFRHQWGADYCRQQSIPHNEATIITTDGGVGIQALLGVRLQPRDIHFVDGWEGGKHAEEIKARLDIVVERSRV